MNAERIAKSELYEAKCAEACRLYSEGRDTTEIDAECDALQFELTGVAVSVSLPKQSAAGRQS